MQGIRKGTSKHLIIDFDIKFNRNRFALERRFGIRRIGY
jgi:hypothetical protein